MVERLTMFEVKGRERRLDDLVFALSAAGFMGLLLAGLAIAGHGNPVDGFLALPDLINAAEHKLWIAAVAGWGAVIYFLPTFIAYSRKHRNMLAVGALNLGLGWTFVGWWVALVWALYREKA